MLAHGAPADIGQLTELSRFFKTPPMRGG